MKAFEPLKTICFPMSGAVEALYGGLISRYDGKTIPLNLNSQGPQPHTARNRSRRLTDRISNLSLHWLASHQSRAVRVWKLTR